jgi:glycine/D-amino acid oxidase-like deaminating enzyme
MMSAASVTLPDRARVVVIGGGVIGTSVAYHLGHLGWSDVVLVERDQLTSGTTWHAAGLMVTASGPLSETSTVDAQYTRDLYAGSRPRRAWRPGSSRSASSRLAATPAGSRSTAASPRSTATAASTCTRSTGARWPSMFPLAVTDDLLAGFYVPADGRVNPVDVTMSLAKGARMQGVTHHRGRVGEPRCSPRTDA